MVTTTGVPPTRISSGASTATTSRSIEPPCRRTFTARSPGQSGWPPSAGAITGDLSPTRRLPSPAPLVAVVLGVAGTHHPRRHALDAHASVVVGLHAVRIDRLLIEQHRAFGPVHLDVAGLDRRDPHP